MTCAESSNPLYLLPVRRRRPFRRLLLKVPIFGSDRDEFLSHSSAHPQGQPRRPRLTLRGPQGSKEFRETHQTNDTCLKMPSYPYY